jgi:hypothetical protein
MNSSDCCAQTYRDSRDGTARTSYDDLVRRAGLNRRNVG